MHQLFVCTFTGPRTIPTAISSHLHRGKCEPTVDRTIEGMVSWMNVHELPRSKGLQLKIVLVSQLQFYSIHRC